MRKSLSGVFRRLGGGVTYGVLLLFRSPVDTVLFFIYCATLLMNRNATAF